MYLQLYVHTHILSFTYACLLLKVHGELLLDSTFYISYWNRYVTERVWGQNGFIVTKREIGRGGQKSSFVALHTYWRIPKNQYFFLRLVVLNSLQNTSLDCFNLFLIFMKSCKICMSRNYLFQTMHKMQIWFHHLE